MSILWRILQFTWHGNAKKCHLIYICIQTLLSNEIDVAKCWEHRHVHVLVDESVAPVPQSTYSSSVHGQYWPSCIYGGVEYTFASWVQVRSLKGYQLFCGAIRRREPSGSHKWGAIINRGIPSFLQLATFQFTILQFSYFCLCLWSGSDDGGNNSSTWWKMREVCMLINIEDLQHDGVISPIISNRTMIALQHCINKFFTYTRAAKYAILGTGGSTSTSNASKKRTVSLAKHLHDASRCSFVH